MLAFDPALYHGAFMPTAFGQLPPGVAAEIAAAPAAPLLADYTLAIKDVYDITGLINGVGSPVWAAQQTPATRTAFAPLQLLRAGAQWQGLTITDELTYSLAGINVHYGSPINPLFPSCLTGGSSSGSAAAVAGNHADIGLGTDCGGSIRLPASYCGLWSLRPTHGRISAQGCFALAHSFDTVGWLTRNSTVLCASWQALSGEAVPSTPPAPCPLLVSDDVLALLSPPVRAAFEASLAQLAAQHAVERLPVGTWDLPALQQTFRTLQAAEIWAQHGAWFAAHGQSMGEDIRQRFLWASNVTDVERGRAQAMRQQLQHQLQSLLQGGAMLVLPTVPDMAPAITDSPAHIDQTRQRAMQVLCLAGLGGLPQVTMPWYRTTEGTIGLSLVGAANSDSAVLAMGQRVAQTLSGDA